VASKLKFEDAEPGTVRKPGCLVMEYPEIRFTLSHDCDEYDYCDRSYDESHGRR
jgi:hypothetical protein